MKLDDEIVDLAEWHVIRVSPAVMRPSRRGQTDSTYCVSAGDGQKAGTRNETRLFGFEVPSAAQPPPSALPAHPLGSASGHVTTARRSIRSCASTTRS